MLKIPYGNKTEKENLTMGRYPAPVVAAIGCGDHPPAGPPVFAAFFGEFHCIPLQKEIFVTSLANVAQFDTLLCHHSELFMNFIIILVNIFILERFTQLDLHNVKNAIAHNK